VLPGGFSNPTVSHDQCATNTIGLHVIGDAGDGGSAGRFAYSASKFGQSDVCDLCRKKMHRGVYELLAIENCAIERAVATKNSKCVEKSRVLALACCSLRDGRNGDFEKLAHCRNSKIRGAEAR